MEPWRRLVLNGVMVQSVRRLSRGMSRLGKDCVRLWHARFWMRQFRKTLRFSVPLVANSGASVARTEEHHHNDTDELCTLEAGAAHQNRGEGAHRVVHGSLDSAKCRNRWSLSLELALFFVSALGFVGPSVRCASVPLAVPASGEMKGTLTDAHRDLC